MTLWTFKMLVWHFSFFDQEWKMPKKPKWNANCTIYTVSVMAWCLVRSIEIEMCPHVQETFILFKTSKWHVLNIDNTDVCGIQSPQNLIVDMSTSVSTFESTFWMCLMDPTRSHIKKKQAAESLISLILHQSYKRFHFECLYYCFLFVLEDCFLSFVTQIILSKDTVQPKIQKIQHTAGSMFKAKHCCQHLIFWKCQIFRKGWQPCIFFKL